MSVMTNAAADYDRAVRTLRMQSLPAYVEYTQEGDARGIARWHGDSLRILVDVKAKKIVSVTPHPQQDDWGSNGGDTPVTRRVFNPDCYVAAEERRTNWNGHDAIAINVRATRKSCDDEFDVSTIYADGTTLQLLGADGNETDEGMSVDFSVQYAPVGQYIMPAVVSAHAHGHGWLFWARERAEIRYTNYVFTNVRRQTP